MSTMIKTDTYFFRDFDKTMPDGTVRRVNDYVHLKQKIAPTKFIAAVVGEHRTEKAVIDIKTLEGAQMISKFEFEKIITLIYQEG